MIWRAPIAAALAATTACVATPDVAPQPWSESDSAGITIVENRASEATEGGWSVDPVPLLDIGGLDAPEEAQLFQVNGGTRLEDGRLAVASSGTHDIRVFGPDAELQARFGTEGSGPGELQGATLVGRRGADTLVVFDADLSRINWFHAEQGFLASHQVQWDGQGFPVGRRLLGDGSMLIGGGMSFSSTEGFPTGVIRPLSTFGWVGPDGTGGIQLGDFPAAEMFARASEQGFMARGLPFARLTVAAAATDGVWLGTGDSWELGFYGLDGTLRRLLRVGGQDRVVSGADRETYEAEMLADASTDNERRQLRGLLEEMPFPEAFPPYRRAVVDALGFLWVEDYPAPGDTQSSWTVFDAGGRWQGRVQTPPHTSVLEIGADYLLGRSLDEMDVESLTLWRLHRAG
jgi:hypothetical protein